MSTIKTAHDVFWLARYAHNTLDPMVKEAQRYEPSIRYQIEMRFRDVCAWQPGGVALTIAAHWNRDGMLLHELAILTKEGVDRAGAKVKEFIEREESLVVES